MPSKIESICAVTEVSGVRKVALETARTAADTEAEAFRGGSGRLPAAKAIAAAPTNTPIRSRDRLAGIIDLPPFDAESGWNRARGAPLVPHDQSRNKRDIGRIRGSAVLARREFLSSHSARCHRGAAAGIQPFVRCEFATEPPEVPCRIRVSMMRGSILRETQGSPSSTLRTALGRNARSRRRLR